MFITTADAKIFAIAFGPAAARPILGLGGWIGNWELWAGPFSILSAAWRTIAYDHRGAGATIAPVKSITFDRLVDDVFLVLDAFGVERSILAAESAGAAVALGAALRQPDRVAGLVIVDGFIFRGTSDANDPFLAGLKSNYARTLDGFVQECVPEKDCEHIQRWGRQILDRAAPEAAVALYRLTGKIDLRRSLRWIKQPALILHGDADTLVPMESARWLADRLPNSKLTILPGAGHVPTLTRPVEVAREIAGFFERRK